MDIKNYLDKKAKKLATIIKIMGGYAIAFKKFNPEDGSQLEPEIQTISVDELNKQKEDLQEQIKDIDAILSDIKALG
jgi:Sec-independent protein translocase protein TatA